MDNANTIEMVKIPKATVKIWQEDEPPETNAGFLWIMPGARWWGDPLSWDDDG